MKFNVSHLVLELSVFAEALKGQRKRFNIVQFSQLVLALANTTRSDIKILPPAHCDNVFQVGLSRTDTACLCNRTYDNLTNIIQVTC